MRILWMIPKWTFPIIDGARVATHRLIKNTAAAGASIDILCLAAPDEKIELDEMKRQWDIGEITVFRRKTFKGYARYVNFLKKFLREPHIPLTFSSFHDRSLKQKVLSHLKEEAYDIVVLDGLHLAMTLLDEKTFSFPEKMKIVYRAHNIEADLWYKASQEKNIFLGKLLSQQAKLVQDLERHIWSHADGIASIAQEDLMKIPKPEQKLKFIPLGLDFSSPLNNPSNKWVKFLFIGRLDWPPNRDGLTWLLKEVWPKVIERRPLAKLKIVGSGDCRWLSRYRKLKGIEFHGFVEDVKTAYEDCHFTLVPIAYGSGTRIKVLESFAMGRKLISTFMGVQGAGLTESDYIRAEKADEWISLLSEITHGPKHQLELETSRKKLAEVYCEKKIGRQFYDWVRTLA